MLPLPSHATFQSMPGSDLLARLNPLDWVLLLTVALSTVLAFMRGLIRSLIALAGVVVGVVLAAWYTPDAALWLRRWVSQPALAEILAFVAILAACYILAALLGRVIRGACQAVGLGFLDRLGGAAFGFARSVIVLAALFVPAAPFLALLPFTRDSILLPYLRTAAHGISFVMPRDFADRLPAGARLGTQPLPNGRRRSARVLPESIPDTGTTEGDAQ